LRFTKISAIYSEKEFQMEQFLQDHVWSLAHWPWLSACFILMIIMQVLKSSVFTKKRAYTKGRAQSFWWWAWKTLPVQPIFFGMGIGWFWPEPEPGIAGVAAVMYFASAGALSVWVYQVLKGLAKKRNIDLTLPGQSTTPPEDE
jgi:hypothetical protein